MCWVLGKYTKLWGRAEAQLDLSADLIVDSEIRERTPSGLPSDAFYILNQKHNQSSVTAPVETWLNRNKNMHMQLDSVMKDLT